MTAHRALIADASQQAVDLTRLGGRPKAKAICPESLGHQADPSDALLLVGVIDMVAGRAAEAAAAFKNSIRINPSQPIAHALLGDALLDLGRPEDALGNYDRALQSDSRLIAAHFGRGNALVELERPLEALASYENVLRLQPRHSEALIRRGNILLRQKDFTAALDSYDAALRLRGDFVEALCGRGDALLDLQRPEEALPCFDEALRLDPNNSVAIYNRGNAMLAMGQRASALASFKRANLQQPGPGDVMDSRGDLLPAPHRPETPAECLAELLQADTGFDNAPAADLPSRSHAPVANFLTRSIVLTMLVSFAVSFGIMYRQRETENRSESTLDAASRFAVSAPAAAPTTAAVRPPAAALQPPLARASEPVANVPRAEEAATPEDAATAQPLPVAVHLWNRRDLGRFDGYVMSRANKPMSITMRAVSASTQASSEIHFELGPRERKDFSSEEGLYMETNDQLTVQSPPYQDQVFRVP